MGFGKDRGFGGGHGGKKSFGGAKFGGKKPFGQGGGGGFGGAQKEMFSAVCATCQNACEVPFKPSGDRPVFCRDCFSKDGAPRGELAPRDNARSFNKFDKCGPSRDFAPRAPQAMSMGGDKRIDELKRQIDAVHNKLDVVVKMIEKISGGATVKSELAQAVGAAVETAEPVAKPVKKAAKKKAAKK